LRPKTKKAILEDVQKLLDFERQIGELEKQKEHNVVERTRAESQRSLAARLSSDSPMLAAVGAYALPPSYAPTAPVDAHNK
jgi:hypothetical protein